MKNKFFKVVLSLILLSMFIIPVVAGPSVEDINVTNFQGEALSDSIIRLTWNDSLNISYDHVKLYQGGNWVTDVDAWVEMYDVVNLNPNTSYTFQAKSGDYLDNTYNSTINCTVKTLEEGYTAFLPLDSNIERGSSWIKWQWNTVISNLTVDRVLIDGIDINTQGNEYLISDLNPNEEHILELYHNGSLLFTSVVKTHPSEVIFMIILMVSSIFLVTSIFVKDIYQIIILSILACLLSTYLIMSSSQVFWVISLIGLFISIISGVILIITLLDLYYN